METSADIKELATALFKVQRTLKPALKDTDNPFFKSKYADLGSVWAACDRQLCDNDIVVIQAPGFEPGFATLTTRLLHAPSGQWIQEKAGCKLLKDDAQGYGSAISYLRRYSLSALLGILADDDDGNAAVTAPQKPFARPSQPVPYQDDEAQRKANAQTVEWRKRQVLPALGSQPKYPKGETF